MWKVTSNSIGGQTMYAVFRIREAGQLDHSGNREYYTGYLDSKQEAKEIADALNAEERGKAIIGYLGEVSLYLDRAIAGEFESAEAVRTAAGELAEKRKLLFAELGVNHED